MQESNNVLFIETNGKWNWKRYDENGRCIYKSYDMDSEDECRKTYNSLGCKSFVNDGELYDCTCGNCF